jgi:hypothetical protein|tara:strand:- start:3144 stop:4055 length:912 start_codon:yes stop_codon:yes gene_type:complete
MRNFVFFAIVITLLFAYVLNKSHEVVVMKHKISKHGDNEDLQHYYFQNYLNLGKSKKPIVFVHTTSSQIELCNMCIRSLINVIGSDVDIVLYDNETVHQLIQEQDETDLCNIKNPNMLQGVDLKQWENYIKAKLLYKYGGIVMEPYFYFTKKPLRKLLYNDDLYILHHANEGMNVSAKEMIPWINYFMSAPAKNKNTKVYMKYLEYLCTSHSSEDHKHFDKSFEKLYALKSIEPMYMGINDANKDVVQLHQLFEAKNIQMSNSMFCLFVNIPLLEKSRHYGYVLNMNEKQLKSMNNYLSALMR